MFKIFKKNQTTNTEEKNTEIKSESKPQTKAEIKTGTTPSNSNGKIAYDDFAKIEMRVGEIISAEKIENADRLLKLKVDFGTETRQIVSGIAEYFDPAELIGTRCPFVTNLEPRNIRGEESNGMILAAKDSQNNFSLLKVEPTIEKGTKLS